MSRYLGPVCRLCRREGIKLMLKGARCESAKCPMEKPSRNVPPGASRTIRRRSNSEFGKRLREKQKVKRYYGLFDKQFRKYFNMAQKSRDNTGEALLRLLERRLDNVVCKLGFAPSRKAARIFIGHKHITVNGQMVNKPGYLVKIGDTIGVRNKEASRKLAQAYVEEGVNRVPQTWLKLDEKQLTGEVEAMPTRDDIMIPVEEQLVVEFLSR